MCVCVCVCVCVRARVCVCVRVCAIEVLCRWRADDTWKKWSSLLTLTPGETVWWSPSWPCVISGQLIYSNPFHLIFCRTSCFTAWRQPSLLVVDKDSFDTTGKSLNRAHHLLVKFTSCWLVTEEAISSLNGLQTVLAHGPCGARRHLCGDCTAVLGSWTLHFQRLLSQSAERQRGQKTQMTKHFGDNRTELCSSSLGIATKAAIFIFRKPPSPRWLCDPNQVHPESNALNLKICWRFPSQNNLLSGLSLCNKAPRSHLSMWYSNTRRPESRI